MKFVKFTLASNNQPCFINPEFIQYITKTTDDSGTAIWAGDLSAIKNHDSVVPLVVKEKLNTVIKKCTSR